MEVINHQYSHQDHKPQMLHEHQHTGHMNHERMIPDFRKRFWISLILTIPVLLLSLAIQEFLHLGTLLYFKWDIYVFFGLSSIIFFYGGYPFLIGIFEELSKARPGMMTLIAVAITTAYLYSSLVVFDFQVESFFGNFQP